MFVSYTGNFCNLKSPAEISLQGFQSLSYSIQQGRIIQIILEPST